MHDGISSVLALILTCTRFVLFFVRNRYLVCSMYNSSVRVRSALLFGSAFAFGLSTGPFCLFFLGCAKCLLFTIIKYEVRSIIEEDTSYSSILRARGQFCIVAKQQKTLRTTLLSTPGSFFE